MVPYLLGGMVLLYVAFVIVKKVKEVKRGQYCSCGCDNCPSKCNASNKDSLNKKKEI